MAGTIVSGILAGGVFDRVIVGGPAWHKLGADAWAQYSRHADLGTGLVVYPAEGIGAALLLLAAAVSYRLDGHAQRRASILLYSAAALSIAGLLLTVEAAPIMLGLGSAQPIGALRRALDDFFFWGLYLRGSADLLAFLSAAWALSVVRTEG